jgi:hypothetical protein
LCRGFIGFKKGYQLGTNIVKDEKCDLDAESQSILGRGRNQPKMKSKRMSNHQVLLIKSQQNCLR